MESIEISPTLLIVAGLICVGMGIFATMLLNTLREDEGTVNQDSDTPPGGKKGRYTPIVRLWREKGSGRLIVETDGKSLVAPDPLNEVQRERLEKVARDFDGWLGIEPAAGVNMPARPAAPVMQPPSPSPAGPSRAPAPPPDTTPARPYTAPPQPARAPAAAPVPPANTFAEAAAVVSSNKSIVMQIEDILQEMLEGSPYEHRGIHLSEDPMRGVMVSVGASYYEGIDAVPDPDIKAMIRAAVAEWEKSR